MKHSNRLAMLISIAMLLTCLCLAGCGSSGQGGSGTSGQEQSTGGQKEAAEGEDISAGDASSGADSDSASDQAHASEDASASAGESAAADTVRPEPELASMYIYESSEDNETVYVSGSHESLRLAPENEQEFPALSAALNQIMMSETKEVKERKADYAYNYKNDDTAADFAPEGYEITDKYYVRRSDRKVFSVLESSFDFGGGVHGYYGYSTLNLDAETGKNIALSDVIADRDRLANLLKTKLREEYPEDSFFEDMEETIEKEVNEVREDDFVYELNWVLDPTGMTFFFNPYDIGPWAAGTFTTTILYTEDRDLFTGQYLPEEGTGYICAFPLNENMNVDVDGDGKEDHISVSYTMGENENIQELSVKVNQKHLTIDDIYCYSVEPKLVLTADGQIYLYAWCRSDNDYVNMYVFDINKGNPVSYDPLPLSEIYSYDEEENADYQSWKRLLIDPDRMPMGTRIDLLSTYTGTRTYHIEDGPVPQNREAAFSIDRDITLVSVEDITAATVDADGKTGAKITVPSGSHFTLKLTDGETYVDAGLSDGSMVRLPVEGTYPQYINGTEADKLFEELFFAG